MLLIVVFMTVQVAGLAKPRLEIQRTTIYRGQVNSVLQRSDGRIVVSGKFPQTPFPAPNTGLPVEIAILETNGAVLQRIRPPQIQEPGIPILFNWRCLAVLPDHSMIVERSVREPFKDEVIPRKLLRILPDGRVDLKSPLPLGQVSVQPDGGMLVAGLEVNRENGDSSYNALGLYRFALGTAPNGVGPAPLLVDYDFAENLILNTYAGSKCLATGPVPDGSIYLWLAPEQVPVNTIPLARLGRLLSDGRRDDSFRPPDSLVRRVDSEFAWLPLPDGKLLVSLINGNGNSLTQRLNRDGSIDLTFQLSGFRETIGDFRLGAGPDGPVVYGRDDYGEQRLARLLSNGRRDLSFVLELPAHDGIYGMVQLDGKVLVLKLAGGDAGGHTVVSLLRINPDGKLDQSFDASSLGLFPGIRLSASGLEPGRHYVLAWGKDMSDIGISRQAWEVTTQFEGSGYIEFSPEVFGPGDGMFDDGPARFYRLTEQP